MMLNKQITKTGKGRYIVRVYQENRRYIDHQFMNHQYSDAFRYFEGACNVNYYEVKLIKGGKNSKVLHKRESFTKEAI